GGGAGRLDLAVREHAQQLPLHAERQLADLVQEDRPAVRRLEQALAVAVRAGERAAEVPEELALEQRRRERRAVADHERANLQRRQVVQRAGDELLARPALAGDERRRGVAREALDEREHAEHLLRARDDALERDAALEPLLEDARPMLELALLERRLQHACE